MLYLDTPPPIPIAHRGGDVAAPENTVAAFDHAWSLGFRHLETDVHLTADGVLVAIHDVDLERVAGLPGTIAEHTWDVLQTVDLGDGHGIPTLDELFVTFPGAAFNIDPKADAAVPALGDLIATHGAVERVGIGSFDDARISALQARFGPALCTSPGPVELLTFFGEDEPPDDALRSHRCLQIPRRFGHLELTQALLDDAHRRGLQVHVWTINEAAEMHELLDLGVDALMTDKTDLLRDVLLERDQWNPIES